MAAYQGPLTADSIRPATLESVVTEGTGSTAVDTHGRQDRIHTLPAWIGSYDAGPTRPLADQARLLNRPQQTVPPPRSGEHSKVQRRTSKDGYVWEEVDPEVTRRKGRPRVSLIRRSGAERGRKWDHLRSAEPVFSSYITTEQPADWGEYLHEMKRRDGRLPGEYAELVNDATLDELMPGLNVPVRIPHHPLDPKGSGKGRRSALYKRIGTVLLQHPLVPLMFRLLVLGSSLIALGIAGKILKTERNNSDPYDEDDSYRAKRSELTQALVAVVVDVVAVVYIIYMIRDEYTGKPLGLRSATQKIKLLLMDLFFIIMKSASTTLAFESLVFSDSRDTFSYRLAQSLAAFLLIGLVFWNMTLAVNVLRLVEKLGGDDNYGVH